MSQLGEPRSFLFGLFCAVILLVALACGEWQKSSAVLHLEFAVPEAAVKVAGRGKLRSPPSTASDMDCFVVNVRGEGVFETFAGRTFNDENVTARCLQLGTVSPAVNLSRATTDGIRLPVRPGANRQIQVLGVYGNAACAGKTLDQLLADEGLELYLLGSTSTSIVSDVRLTIANSYTATGATDLADACADSSSGTGGGGGSGLAKVFRFNPADSPIAFTDMGINAREIKALMVSSGYLYVGGDFENAGGNSIADYVARVPTAGGIWESVLPNLTQPVHAISKSTGGNLYLGGAFENAAGDSSADGVVYFNPVTSSWNPVSLGLQGGAVHALATNGSNIYIGGEFTASGGNQQLASFVVWNEAGSWNLMGQAGPFGDQSGSPDKVYAIQRFSGTDSGVGLNSVYVGGEFSDAYGQLDADNLVLIDPDASIGNRVRGPILMLSGPVNALNYVGVSLVVGGSFSVNAASPNLLFFADQLTAIAAVGGGTTGRVRALLGDGTGMFVGGDFSAARLLGGSALVGTSRFARFSGTGFSAIKSGVNGSVQAIATDGTNIYIGGKFTGEGDPAR